MTTSATAPAKKRGGALIWVGLVLGLLGMALAGFSGWKLATSTGFNQAITAPVDQVPGTITRSLEVGQYSVYSADVLPGSGPNFAAITGITVAGPNGEDVPVSPIGYSETLTRGTQSYTAEYTFDVRTAGQHVIVVEAEQPTTVLVAPALVGVAQKAAGWIGGLVLGGFLALIGLILLVVGFVRRSRPVGPAAPTGYAVPPSYGAPPATGYAGPPPAAGYASPPPAAAYGPPPTAAYAAPPPAAPPPAAPPPAAPPVATPAGWYPDPQQPGLRRYWDGTAWTEHRA